MPPQPILIRVGVVFVILSVPVILKMVKPNHWYGFRTPKTLSNEPIWYKANYVFGWDLTGAGAVVILAAFVMPDIATHFPDVPAQRLKAVVIRCNRLVVRESVLKNRQRFEVPLDVIA